MHPARTSRFFRTLAREFNAPARIILTGAAAGSLWGHVRSSQDVDFAVQLPGGHPADWERFQAAVARAAQATGIQVNYAEDIDRWSSITLLDYRRHATAYRRFGSLDVRLLDPAYWTIGKLGRYFEVDVDDLVAVLKRRRLPVEPLVRLWARALRESPRSAAISQFRAQVEHFLRTYGRALWGARFDPDEAVSRFLRLAAGKPRSRRRR